MSDRWRWGCAAAAVSVFLLAAFMGLWFSGILSFGRTGGENKDGSGGEYAAGAGSDGEYTADAGLDGEYTAGAESDGEYTAGVESGGEDTAGAENGANMSEAWEIVFKGMKFAVPEKGMACVHESGCMNIRQQDEYLIQIDIEDDTVEELWERMDSKKKSLTDSGYRIEEEPQLLDRDGQTYIRYAISMADERGSDFDRSFYEVLLFPADAGRRFLAVLRFDGIDMERLETKRRSRMYEEAEAAALNVLVRAVPTKERDDPAGTLWMEDENLDPNGAYRSEDSILCGDGEWIVSYRLPENSQIVFDDLTGKTYLDTDEQIYIRINTLNYTWLTAEDMVRSSVSSRLSETMEQGEIEWGGRTFYYDTYSVLEYGKTKKLTHYYFEAYCDLENGDIFCICGFADDRPEVLDELYYLDIYDITETEAAENQAFSPQSTVRCASATRFRL